MDSEGSQKQGLPTSTHCMVGKPLKAEPLSTCTLGVGLLLSRPSPGVEMPVADLLRAHLGGGCPTARFLGTGMLMECPKDTPLFEGVPCTALMLSSKPLRSCSAHSTDESMALDTALIASSVSAECMSQDITTRAERKVQNAGR